MIIVQLQSNRTSPTSTFGILLIIRNPTSTDNSMSAFKRVATDMAYAFAIDVQLYHLLSPAAQSIWSFLQASSADAADNTAVAESSTDDTFKVHYIPLSNGPYTVTVPVLTEDTEIAIAIDEEKFIASGGNCHLNSSVEFQFPCPVECSGGACVLNIKLPEVSFMELLTVKVNDTHESVYVHDRDVCGSRLPFYTQKTGPLIYMTLLPWSPERFECYADDQLLCSGLTTTAEEGMCNQIRNHVKEHIPEYVISKSGGMLSHSVANYLKEAQILSGNKATDVVKLSTKAAFEVTCSITVENSSWLCNVHFEKAVLQMNSEVSFYGSLFEISGKYDLCPENPDRIRNLLEKEVAMKPPTAKKMSSKEKWLNRILEFNLDRMFAKGPKLSCGL
ncbi:hypothetical protein SprV_0200606200 [Sparganum proliferum]